jgi:uncharacterized protein (TIGR00251 family)
MTRLMVKVATNASQDRIIGWHDGALKMRVKAKAVKGQANKAVRRLLAETLAIPLAQVTVKSGATSTRKTMWIQDMSEQQLAARLANLEIGDNL